MDILALKEYILQNSDYVEMLLSEAGFCKIKKHNNEYRCARNEDSNPTSIRVNLETLKANDFSKNVNGDIITLLEEKLGLNFPKTLQWIGKTLGIDLGDDSFKKAEVNPPFGGFFNRVFHPSQPMKYSNQIYRDDILLEYLNIPSQRFLDSNISITTQMKYDIGYDVRSGRITIPWRNQFGEIIGIMGRLNKNELDVDDNKYYPILKFNKEGELYGYSHNYKDIIENDMVVILESEKATMQLDTMGYKIGVSLGGNAITQSRENLIKALNVSTVIVGYDEGLDVEVVFNNAKKLKTNNTFFNNKVGVVYDKNNDILPIGSKMSPTDMGKEAFDKLIREKVVWI